MPRKKKVRSSLKSTKRLREVKSIQEKKSGLSFPSFKWGESYTSLLMGFIAVIIAALFVGSLFRQHHKPLQQTSSISITPTQQQMQNQQPSVFTGGSKKYTVQPGDDLWHIAEKFYQSGYNWVDIAAVNKLDNPGLLFSGQQLTIPNVTPKVSTVETTVQTIPQTNAITGSSYTVQKGDSLWDIAVRAYGDGYKWTDIAKANNLENPGLIFSGNIFQIPR